MLAVLAIGLGCGGTSAVSSAYYTVDGSVDGHGGSKPDGTVGAEAGMLKTVDGCVPSTCAELHANCGKSVTDPKCGGVVDCSAQPCPSGTACGGGGVPNQCGSGGGGPNDACTRLTCESQSITCGQAGDGCGGMLECGSCTAPQSCGGGTNPGQCGCSGLCAQIPACAGDAGGLLSTTLSGKVYDPAGTYGLYHALVYVPNNPNDPGLKPFPPGITCDICGSTAAGDPLVSAFTGTDGSFTLSGVPVGSSIPLVIQLGRWRRQFTFNVATPCGSNSIPDQTLLMPKNHTQGDMPRVAIVTGSFDPVECVLEKIGIDMSEFTDPGGGGYIQFFTANDPSAPDPAVTQEGSGAVLSASTPSQDALFATTGGPANGPLINNYDMAILECEGYPETQTVAQQAALATYAAAGGRVFASDYAYTWLSQNPALMAAADWDPNQDGNGSVEVGIIDQPPENPTGAAFESWLGNVGFSSAANDYVLLTPVFHNTDKVLGQTQEWLHSQTEGGASTTPVHFTFNTAITAPPANQCGRITFSDWHAQGAALRSYNTTFPNACPSGPLTPQDAILEFALFDLSACVQPYAPLCTPRTCMQAGSECGPTSDGCGNLIQCGTCSAGQTCGGAGAGKCGASTSCTPVSCSAQSIQCGPAGDGCGNEIQCGNCPTGSICGLNGPGQCGAPAK
jgi:hypothetical protein